MRSQQARPRLGNRRELRRRRATSPTEEVLEAVEGESPPDHPRGRAGATRARVPGPPRTAHQPLVDHHQTAG
jgi:hypothetical protein